MPTLDNPLFVHNLRAGDQWHIISHHLDFVDRSVIDYGCGYGDILRHALYVGGASYCVGVDDDRNAIDGMADRCPSLLYDSAFTLFHADVEEFVATAEDFDIGICFSLLPYLRRPDAFLENMAKSCEAALIECQYVGDGPGFDTLRDDVDMEEWLGVHWHRVEKIGFTVVEYRNKQRTIWLCQ